MDCAPEDVIELTEMLGFLRTWLSGEDTAELAASFRRFVRADGYDLAELRSDLARFVFLLGGDGGEDLFGPEPL